MRRIVRSSDGSIAKNIRMVCFLGAKPSDIWLIKGWLHGWCRYLSRFLMVTWMMGNYAVTGPTHIWNHLNATSTQSVSLAEPFLRFFLALQPWNGVLNTSTPSFRPEVLVFVYIGKHIDDIYIIIYIYYRLYHQIMQVFNVIFWSVTWNLHWWVRNHSIDRARQFSCSFRFSPMPCVRCSSNQTWCPWISGCSATSSHLGFDTGSQWPEKHVWGDQNRHTILLRYYWCMVHHDHG